ncbi:2-oxoglutarate and Fe(II)-dependent oxygenase superfamily protein isoform 2 [Hibiscus syriacus]|uniref:2-oxoglutarate and Fe(II)-dependent oxygenase superfamily protein isoform 2 n=1 Tax=Hibiscus syriacus TaxID=106335 RepID=A0A6A3D7Z6_HIBSY|nr:2-oxoglutarate and Fe(II)-dependent oxygenase superfamily protein isoform 2 [Hibiscus syriacus]
MGFCFGLLSCSLLLVSSQAAKGDDDDDDDDDAVEGTVYIDGKAPIGTIDDDFVCATLDCWPPEKCDYGTCSWGLAGLLNLPPPEFHVKDSSSGGTDSSHLSSTVYVPIIDLSVLLSSKDELEKLKLALESGGCFQAIGHGMSSSFIDDIRRVAKQFFGLPQEEKLKYSREANGVEGYATIWWSQTSKFLTGKLVPQAELSSCREFLHEYSIKLKQMMDLLFKAMAKSLDLEESSFSGQFGGNQAMQVRFNFYPPCSNPDEVLGVKPHSDRSGVAVLLQDKEVEGLQIVKDERRITVPVIPHALVVNLGDQMQIMSNGVFKSPVNRVVTNTDKLRISVAMFNVVEPENEIGPVEALIDDNRPRSYRNVKNYASFNYECFQKGTVALEEVKFHA